MNAIPEFQTHVSGYTPGHPWFYVLGGAVPSLKAIRAEVERTGYKGYRTDIDAADQKPEPKRSLELRRLQTEIMQDMKKDVRRYREVALELVRYRRGGGAQVCGDVHTSVSLKYAHLFNGFAHLRRLEQLKSSQGSLFDLL